MAGRSAKTKGKSYEREVCQIMKDIFGGNWIRSFTSGAFTGGVNAARLAQLTKNQIQNNRGDICVDDSMSNLVIECKSYKDFSWNVFTDTGSNAQLDGWLEQIENDVVNNEFYFLTFKINNCGRRIVVRTDLTTDCVIPTNYSVYLYNDRTYYVCKLEDFLKNNVDKIRDKCKPQ